MKEIQSIRQKVEDTERHYDILMDNEEYKLDNLQLTDKQRQKILGRLYQLQEERKVAVQMAKQGPNKFETAADSIGSFSKGMTSAGDSIVRTGVLIFLWIFAFPIMLPLWLLKVAFFPNKK